MRYTPFGVGHPVTIRKMIKDCLRSRESADTMDVVSHDSDHEEVSDDEGFEEVDDEGLEEVDDEQENEAFSDEELEDEEGDEEEGIDSNEFDDLSF